MVHGGSALIDLDVLLEGEAHVLRALEEIDLAFAPKALAEFHRLFTRQIFQDRVTARFKSEGDPAVGGPWAQLTQTRIDIREHANQPGAHPINRPTGEMQNWLEKSQGRSVPTGAGATFSWPGAIPKRRGIDEKYRTAQQGKLKGNLMPDGWGGMKPSPSPTPPRPVVGMDETDMMHVMAALELYTAAVLAKAEV